MFFLAFVQIGGSILVRFRDWPSHRDRSLSFSLGIVSACQIVLVELETILSSLCLLVDCGELTVAVVVEPVAAGFLEREHDRVARRSSPGGARRARHLIVVDLQAPHNARQAPSMQAAAGLRCQLASISNVGERRIERKLVQLFGCHSLLAIDLFDNGTR